MQFNGGKNLLGTRDILRFQWKIIITRAVEKLVAGYIVADNVVGAPTAEEGEARAQLQLDHVAVVTQVRRGNVANLVAVIDIGGGGRQQRLESLHGYKKNRLRFSHGSSHMVI